jgi:hypothetical protein
MRFKTPFRGVHIGPTCIDGTPYGPNDDAHAHISRAGLKRDLGMICAKSVSSLRELLVHEIAHLAADTGHDDRWRRSVRRLGGRVPAAYKRKPRRRSA